MIIVARAVSIQPSLNISRFLSRIKGKFQNAKSVWGTSYEFLLPDFLIREGRV
jgi:hypothetical protein